jgi:hypothetical protein
MADTAFWIIPWKILLLVFSIVGGFVTLVTWGIKLYVRRMLKLAGVTPGSHRVQVSAIEQIAIATNNKGRKKISIVAPIEAGILDLRARLSKTDTVKMYTQTIISFVRLYWKFFTVISVLIIFIILVILFLKGAFTPSRDFEVTIEGDGQSVTVTGEDTIVEPVEPVGGENNQATTSAVLINIVNRSGIEALTSRVQQSLQTSGYDFNVIEENTVIVYDPSLADDALVISEIMHGAPLSSYAAREGEHPEVVIYIGSDANQD